MAPIKLKLGFFWDRAVLASKDFPVTSLPREVFLFMFNGKLEHRFELIIMPNIICLNFVVISVTTSKSVKYEHEFLLKP